MDFNYVLDKEMYIEFQYLLARFNKEVVRKSYTIMKSLILLAVLITFMALKINLTSILVSLLFMVIIVIFFPRLFWLESKRRIRKVVENEDIVFNHVSIKLEDNHLIVKSDSTIQINLKDIQHVIYGKLICLIIFKENNTVIIPLSSNTNNLEQFNELMKDVTINE